MLCSAQFEVDMYCVHCNWWPVGETCCAWEIIFVPWSAPGRVTLKRLDDFVGSTLPSRLVIVISCRIVDRIVLVSVVDINRYGYYKANIGYPIGLSLLLADRVVFIDVLVVSTSRQSYPIRLPPSRLPTCWLVYPIQGLHPHLNAARSVIVHLRLHPVRM